MGNQTIVSLAQIEASTASYLIMWIYADGEMKEIEFDEYSGLAVSNNTVKIIGDRYLQSYSYFNGMGDPDEGLGWTWNSSKNRFSEYDIRAFTDNEEYGWEMGEYHAKLWSDHERYYLPFLELTFTKQLKDLASKGILINEAVRIGMSIDEVLDESLYYIENSYYEGGMYYSFPGGFAYFYDEDTREITTIALEGSSVTNDPVELKQLLGKPINSGYDGRDQEDYQEFSLGGNTLSIMTTKDGELSTIWFRNR